MDLEEIQRKVVAVSKIYTEKYGIKRDDDWFLLKLQEEIGELTQGYLSLTNRGKTRGMDRTQVRQDFADELSDVFGQILLIANHQDIDIVKGLERKWFKYLPPLANLDSR